MQGAKPHARSMTQIPKRKQNETIKRSQIQKIRATLVQQHGGMIYPSIKKKAIRKRTHFLIAFLFLSGNTPIWRQKYLHSPFRHSGEPLTRVPHAETFPRNLSAPFLSFGKAREFRPLRRSSQGFAPTPHNLSQKVDENFIRLRRSLFLRLGMY